MIVRDVMTHGAECIAPAASLQEAADRMKSLDVGVLPVCENDRLVGMVTDRDITIRATAACCDATGTRVREIMTPRVIYVFDDQNVEEAASHMRDHQIRRLAVLNRDKRLIGMVTLGDLAVETHERELVGATLEAVSEPGRTQLA